ncbi:hypothetical protein JCM10213_003746 [Rhodosporidiobolus nylandii]
MLHTLEKLISGATHPQQQQQLPPPSPSSPPVTSPQPSSQHEPRIPPYLFDYLSDSPLPVAVYSHAALTSSPSLPSPFYQSPSLEAFLYQGSGGAALFAQQQLRLRSRGGAGGAGVSGSKVDKERERAREKAIEAARARAPKDLTSALDEAAREPFRKWLVDGIVAATATATAQGEKGISSSASSVSSSGAPNLATSATTTPTPTPPLTAGGAVAGPSSAFLPHHPPHPAPRPNPPRAASIASSLGTFGSVASTSSGLSHTSRQIGLLLNKEINFSKCYYRARVHPELGFTVLTQLPPSGIANGGQVSSVGEDVTSLSGTTLDGAGSSASGGHGSRGARSLSRSSSGGASGGEGDGNAPPASLFATAASSALDGVDEEDNETEGAEQPPMVEILGDTEVTCEGARDATSYEGLAFTYWNAPVGLFRVNRDLSIVQATPRWRQTCGLTPGETNDAWGARVHPDDRERVLSHYRRITEEMPMVRDECTFRWLPEGEQDQWCVCTIEPCVIAGKMEGYNGMLENINAHKAKETAAEARERQLRDELVTLSETTTVGLVRIDLEGHFLSANPVWYKIVRLDPSRPLDEWVNSMHADDAPQVMEQWAKCLRTREPLTIRFRWYDGDVCLVQAVLNSPNKDEATGWIGSVTDVTAQAKAEEAVLQVSKEREARAKKEAEEAEERRKVAVEEKRQQELLIDVTSHEIRNPISAILQNSDFTRSSLQSLRSLLLSLKEKNALPQELDGKLLADLDEDIEALDSITECGLAQERIANDILGLAQIQLSKYSITPVEFDLATSLRNICRMFKSECRSKGIELKLVIGSSLARLGSRARVFADPARLTQVLVNLLSNAIRFTAKSAVRQVTLAVEVSAKPPDRDSPIVPPHETELHIDQQKPVYLFFSVEDTGPGMTAEETGRLFAKFMQASPFTHTTWGGSGLGLWIARNLCELQAGRIEVASTVGKGSIFRCFITARSVDAGLPHDHEQPVAVIEGITAPNADRGAAPTVYLAKPGENSTPLAGLQILCCEDNQINRTVLKRQLTKEGCEDVLLACDGQEGLDILNKYQPGDIDCILMDIEMPVMDGLTATRAIRHAEQQGQRSGHQRIIGLTGNARNAQKQMALEAGMDAVVTKPYKIADLIEKIRNDMLPNDAGAAHTLVSSMAGGGASATFMSASPGLNEQTFRLEGGASVEVITSCSPTSSSSSRLAEPSSPPRRTTHHPPASAHVHHRSGDDERRERKEQRDERLRETAEEAQHSMAAHGEGRLLPPSQSGERSLEK